ncbi:MAG: hypothetical protein JRH16_19990 [Deltaproteobacteria bacterium]|nr:hypothetical protein [Deltaproteobacteria bacterium]
MIAFEDGELSTVLTPRGRLAVMDVADPRIAESLRLVLELIGRIREDVGERAELGFVLIPTKELVYEDRVRARGVEVHEAFWRLVDAEQELRASVTAHLDALGIPWIDTLPALRNSLETGRRPYRMNWNGHPNPTGNAAIAGAVLTSPEVEGVARRERFRRRGPR